MKGFEVCGGRGQEGSSVFHRARPEVLCPAVGQEKSWLTMPRRQSTILVNFFVYTTHRSFVFLFNRATLIADCETLWLMMKVYIFLFFYIKSFKTNLPDEEY